jgi:hypothetical protein
LRNQAPVSSPDNIISLLQKAADDAKAPATKPAFLAKDRPKSAADLQRRRAAIGLEPPESGPSQFTSTPSRPAIQKAGVPLPPGSTGDLTGLLQDSIDVAPAKNTVKLSPEELINKVSELRAKVPPGELSDEMSELMGKAQLKSGGDLTSLLQRNIDDIKKSKGGGVSGTKGGLPFTSRFSAEANPNVFEGTGGGPSLPIPEGGMGGKSGGSGNAVAENKDLMRATTAIKDAGLIDVDARSTTERGAEPTRMEHPEKGPLIQVEDKDHPGKTMAVYAKDIRSPEQLRGLMNQKLEQFKGSSLSENKAPAFLNNQAAIEARTAAMMKEAGVDESLDTTPDRAAEKAADASQSSPAHGPNARSAEEQSRPGLHYTVDEHGRVTPHGIEFDPGKTRSGSSHVTIKPDGELLTNAGQSLTAKQQLGLKNATKDSSVPYLGSSAKPAFLNASRERRVYSGRIN